MVVMCRIPIARRFLRPATIVLTAVLVCMCCAVDVSRAEQVDIPVLLTGGSDASAERNSDAHLWIIQRKPKDDFLLLHRSNDTSPDSVYRVFQSTGQPIAAAAWTDDLYLVYSDLTMQVIRPVPVPSASPSPVRVTQLKPLPREHRLISFAAGRDGPVALLEPQAEDPDNQNAPKARRLLTLDRNDWVPIDLPAEAATGTVYTHVTVFIGETANADRVGLIADEPGKEGFTLYERRDETWSRNMYPLELTPGARVLTGENNLFVVQRAGPRRTELDVAALRSGRITTMRPISGVETTDYWDSVWHAGTITTVVNRVSGDLEWARHRLSDHGSEPMPLKSMLVGRTAPVPYSPMMLVVIVGVMIGMFFLLAGAKRPQQANEPSIPEGFELAGFHRISAAVVDFAPPLGASMVIFGIADPADVFGRWVNNPSDWTDVLPGATAIGLLVLHTTLSELLAGVTLGKAIFRCRVVNYDGSRPKPWQVFNRNVFKAMELIPPFVLLVMPLLSEFQQRLGDMVSRTIVVRKLHAPEDSGADDDTEGDNE